MTLGLAIVARDEEARLPRLLASIVGAFDQVALLDTGSVDATVELFERWADAQSLPLGHRVGRFEWCDDFAAARNAADELLDTEWLVWADCDDVIEGAVRLRGMAEPLAEDVGGLQLAYAADPNVPTLWPIRLHRRGRGRWRGRLHERLTVEGRVDHRPPEWAYWHHRGRAFDNIERNLRILRKWAAEEPCNERARFLLTLEEASAAEIAAEEALARA